MSLSGTTPCRRRYSFISLLLVIRFLYIEKVYKVWLYSLYYNTPFIDLNTLMNIYIIERVLYTFTIYIYVRTTPVRMTVVRTTARETRSVLLSSPRIGGCDV